MANLEKQLTKQLADFRQIFSNYQIYLVHHGYWD